MRGMKTHNFHVSVLPSTRRYDLDWLRVIAFGLLIYFHTAIAFVPGGIPMIQNDTTSVVLTALVAFLQEFRLALLFLISGAGVCFALRRRTNREFFAERSSRLLKPLAFGIAFLVPPMVYLEKLWTGSFTCSLTAFYGRLLLDGVYPNGHLSWHHFWFLAYLYLFCLIALPVFRRLRDAGGSRVLRLQHILTRGYALYLPILPIAGIEILLRWVFPGFRDLIHDGASFSVWLFVFIAGFIAASCEPLLDHTQTLRKVSLVMAITASALLFVLFWSVDRAAFTPVIYGSTGEVEVSVSRYVLFCVVRALNLWAWLMAILGYAGAHLNRPSRAIAYLNDAVFSLFCVHLTLIVALGYLIVPLDLGLWTKFLLVTTLTTVLALAIYQWVVRRGTLLSPWLGGRQRAALVQRGARTLRAKG
jgi:glucan biosynthesis protein C